MRNTTRGASRRGLVAAFALVLLVVVVATACGAADRGVAHASSNPTLASGRATIASDGQLACPPHVPDEVPASQRLGSGSTLVPGSPTQLLVCRYHGAGQAEPKGTLAESKMLAAGDMAAHLNTGTPLPSLSTKRCSQIPGGTFLMIFAYPDNGRLRVLVGNDVCTIATNGDVRVDAPYRDGLKALDKFSNDTIDPYYFSGDPRNQP